MKLYEVINQLQEIQDKFGESEVEVAHDETTVLDTWGINRICFFKDGEKQTVIIIEDVVY